MMKPICSLGHCECDGHTVCKPSQQRLTADWLAPQESNCSRMDSKISSDWLPSSSSSSGPGAYAPDAPQPIGLLCDPCPLVIFRRSHFRRQVPPRPYDVRDPSSERWYCGRECWPAILPKCWLPHFILGIFYMPQICDMELTALLPLRRKACWGFFRPEKSWRLRSGLNPQTWVLKGSMLPLDHQSYCLPSYIKTT